MLSDDDIKEVITSHKIVIAISLILLAGAGSYLSFQGGDNGSDLRDIDFELDSEPDQGNDSAEIKIVEFSEYSCPICAEFEGVDGSDRLPVSEYEIKEKLKDRYIDTGQIEFVLKDYPQNGLHPNSEKGHKYASCVYQNSNESKYWKAHEEIFERRDGWMKGGQDRPVETFKNISSDIGLTSEAMSCYQKSNLNEIYDDKTSLIAKDGAKGTPSFYVGNNNVGYVYMAGVQPPARFEEVIQKVKEEIRG